MSDTVIAYLRTWAAAHTGPEWILEGTVALGLAAELETGNTLAAALSDELVEEEGRKAKIRRESDEFLDWVAR